MGKWFKKSVLIPTPQEVKDRAQKYAELVPVLVPAAASFYCPDLPVRDQGQYPDCTGFGTGGQQDERVATDIPANPFLTAPLYIFIRGGGGPNGAVMLSILTALNQHGICKETTFPISLLTDINNLPAIPADADYEAANYKAGPPALIQTLEELKDAISKSGPEGTGIAATVGVAVYSDSFENAPGGVILPPGSVPGDTNLGYHDICFVGYDDNLSFPQYPTPGFCKFRNSWGATWGDNGFGYIHYSQITNTSLVNEMWGSVDMIQVQPQPVPVPQPAGQQTATATFTITVSAPPAPVQTLQIVTTTLANAIEGQAYSAPVTVTGGAPAYDFEASGLPDGVAIDPVAGTISGTAGASGSFAVALLVTDSEGNEATATLNLTVIPELVITTTSLPGATAEQAYSAGVAASGGQPRYAFALVSGPAWMSVSAAGAITGTPAVSDEGSEQVVISCKDLAGTQAMATFRPGDPG